LALLMKRSYPDISDILARKAAGRRDAAKRSFAEKISMVEALRERAAPLRQARLSARAKSRSRGGGPPKG